MKKKGFSKNLLIADYAIATALIVGFFICLGLNGIYTNSIMHEMLANGLDVSNITVSPLFNLDGFGILLGSWILQLGVSSGCYYSVVKSERKVQMPMQLIDDLPQDIKENADMTQIIISVLSMNE